MRRLFALVAVLVFLGSCGSDGGVEAPSVADGGSSDGWLGQFDMSTPEATVRTFLDLFHEGDFLSLVLTLSPEGQGLVHQEMSTLSSSFYELSPDALMLIGEQEPEHKYPWSWQRWMRLARSEGLFVVDLAQPSQIVASSSEQVDGFDFRVVEVDLGVGSVRFYVRQVGSRWRISQIVGDGAAYGGPGLLRPGDVRLPSADADEVEAPTGYLDRLDLSTPEAALARFLEAYAALDMYTAFFVLSPQGQGLLHGELGDLSPNLYGGIAVDVMESSAAAGVWEIPLLWQDLERRARDDGVEMLQLSTVPTVDNVTQFDGYVVAETTTAGGKPLGFVMEQSPSGRWRVRLMLEPSLLDSMTVPQIATCPILATETNCPPSPGLSFLPTERIRLETGEIVVVSDNDQVVVVGTDGEIVLQGSCRSGDRGYAEAVEMLTSFQDALARRSSEDLAPLFSFPIGWNRNGSTTTIEDADQLAQNLDQLFDEHHTDQLLNDDPARLFCNADGFTLGWGTIWASHNGIYGVNGD